MCGIAGAITRKEISINKIQKCLSSLNHRGPDHFGFKKIKISNDWHSLQIHTRLSIIDLNERSNQPMQIGDNFLTFNGEIYNYLELRRKYSDHNIYQTASDTEVLGKLLSILKMESLKELEGMWAFSWLDTNKKSLNLCRDKFGKKPLFYHLLSDGGIIYGSTPQAIFDLLGYKLSINFKHIQRYIVNGYKSLFKTEECFFHGLKQVPSGNFLVWNIDSSIKINQWWSPRIGEYEEALSFEEAVSVTRDKLIKALEIRLRSDVPLAFLLSGGIDSNALTHLAKKELGHDVTAFTIINSDKRYEENEMIELALKNLEIDHIPIKVGSVDLINKLKELSKTRSGPVLTISQFAQSILMKEISSRNFKVVISGIGADELFSGYYDHHNAYLHYIANNHNQELNVAIENWKKNAGLFVRNKFLRDPKYFIKNPLARDHIFLDSNVFSGYLNSIFYEPFQEVFFCNDLLRNRMANEVFYEAIPPLLNEEDLNAMTYSIENRCPFLDNALFEWSCKIPSKHLIKNGLAKIILRNSVKDLVPNKLNMNPRKVGFNIPIDSYMNFDEENQDSIVNKKKPIFEIVNFKKVKNLLVRKNNRSNEESKFLFSLISANSFIEAFNQ